MNDFSIDLETLHTRYNAAILSIGCVQFDIATGNLGKEFYVEVEFNSAIKAGKVSGGTLAWWAQQSDKARRIFSDSANKQALSVALDNLRTFLLKTSTKQGDMRVWGNGATFDITILEHAYDNGAVGLPEPWAYWNVRDMRTLIDVAGLDKSEFPPREGGHHNALDDARYQARVMSMAWQRVRGKPATKGEVSPVKVEDDEL